MREVEIEVRPATKLVRFARVGSGGTFREQPLPLGDIKPGWTVSVTTKHEGSRTDDVLHEEH